MKKKSTTKLDPELLRRRAAEREWRAEMRLRVPLKPAKPLGRMKRNDRGKVR
jgi:hypothetical protein